MRKIDFNKNWIFYKNGHGAQKTEVDLPHDAMILEDRIPDLASGDVSGYFPGGRYVYEKRFISTKEMLEGAAILHFDGVYQKSEVYLNDKRVGGHVLGYTNFDVDLTGKMHPDAENVICVKVDNSQTPNSRWYTGSGIYRDVTFFVGGKEHIVPNGISVSTLSLDPVQIEIHVTARLSVEDEMSVSPTVTVLHSGGTEEKIKVFNVSRVRSGKECTYTIQAEMSHAELWSGETPNMYQMEIALERGERLLDRAKTGFGIRTLDWNPELGMTVNGKTVKLRGACIHHDNGILGACEYADVAYRRIRILKECGYNAVRTAHNEPSEVLLEACDRLGMYVMAEFIDVWRASKNDYDYALYFDRHAREDLDRMIQKCAGHPSVVMYSIGNEVYDTRSMECGETCRMLTETIRSRDDTRPITLGFNILGAMSKAGKKPIKPPKHQADEEVNPRRTGKPSPLVSSKLMNTLTVYLPKLMERVTPQKLEENEGFLLDQLDMAGLNYGTHLFTLHDVNPARMIVNTETFPKVIGKTWPDTLSHPWVVGDFMWTGWDYLGECGIGVAEYGKTPLRLNKPFPCISGGTGSVNLVGEIEAQGYYTKTVYGLTDKPYIAVHPVTHSGEKVRMSNWRGTDAVNSWAWGDAAGQVVKVDIYSSEPEVELFQNGSSLGKKATVECKAEYDVVYQKGNLEAFAYDAAGNETGRSSLESADKESRLRIHVEKGILSREEITFVFAEIVDSRGIRKVSEDREIELRIEGMGKLLATGSGSPWAKKPYTGNVAKTWYGTMAGAIKAFDEAGEITITALAKEAGKAACTVQVV